MTTSTEALRERDKAVAIYHVMKRHEDFGHAARALLELVQGAERRWPGKPRFVYLDVEDHRNPEGGLDADAYEFVGEYALGFIGPFISKLTTPLGEFEPEGEQWDDVPEELEIQAARP